MKTLKWFSLEWDEWNKYILIYISPFHIACGLETEQQAFDWLEQNGYIERTKNEK